MQTMLFSAVMASFLAVAAASPVEHPLKARASQGTTSMVVSAQVPTYTPLNSSEILALQQELITAPSQMARENILFPNATANGTNSANNVSFQFINQTVIVPEGGTIAVGSVNNAPGLIGTNVAFAVGFVNACGLNVPHLHPRTNESLTVVKGTLIGAFVLEEDTETQGALPFSK